MKRGRKPQILLTALVAFAAVQTALAADQADRRGGAASVARSGAYSVTFRVTLAMPLPFGSTILCKARAAPDATAPAAPYFEGLSREIFPVLRAHEATASADYTRTGAGFAPAGSTANCTVAIPFTWVSNAPAGWADSGSQADSGSRRMAALSYEILAVSGSGEGLMSARSGEGIGVAYPPAGGVASLSFDVSF